jgi:hypothetical protein
MIFMVFMMVKNNIMVVHLTAPLILIAGFQHTNIGLYVSGRCEVEVPCSTELMVPIYQTTLWFILELFNEPKIYNVQ